jgi:hypothetical protein
MDGGEQKDIEIAWAIGPGWTKRETWAVATANGGVVMSNTREGQSEPSYLLVPLRSLK